jgi:hemerythrin-like domain-containing protein
MSKSGKVGGIHHLLAEDHKHLDNLLSTVMLALKQHDLAEVSDSLDLFWARLAMHIRAENLHLFPSLLKHVQSERGETICNILPASEVERTIDLLTSDHNFFMRELSGAIKLLRNPRVLPNTTELETVGETIRGVTERLKTHNELEELIVYQIPAKLLRDDEQIELMAQIQRELENLPPRFK